MMFLYVIGFLIFFAGLFVVGGVGASLAAWITRNGFLWFFLSLICIIPLQIVYLELINLVNAFRLVEAGDAPYWDRYRAEVLSSWFFWAQFGVVMGVCSWISCLKQYHKFLKPRESVTPDEQRDARTSVNQSS